MHSEKELPDNVEPSHNCLENRLPSDIAAHQGGDGRGGGQEENDYAQEAAMDGSETDETQNTGKEHDQSGGQGEECADGEQGFKIQRGQVLDEGKGSADTPNDVDQADDDMDEFLGGFFHDKG